jgi:hypothetical protein
MSLHSLEHHQRGHQFYRGLDGVVSGAVGPGSRLQRSSSAGSLQSATPVVVFPSNWVKDPTILALVSYLYVRDTWSSRRENRTSHGHWTQISFFLNDYFGFSIPTPILKRNVRKSVASLHHLAIGVHFSVSQPVLVGWVTSSVSICISG